MGVGEARVYDYVGAFGFGIPVNAPDFVNSSGLALIRFGAAEAKAVVLGYNCC